MTSASEKNKSLLRHPLLIVVVTFALSGLMGSVFSQWLAKQAEDAERIRIEAAARKAAVQSFSLYVYERRARAEMLASSFRRNAPLDEVKVRKRLYDDAYVNWNSHHQSNLFLIRDVLESDQYTLFESSVEFVLVGRVFRPLDACLTKAYDARLRNGDAQAIMEDCEGRRLLQEALDCGYAITDELYKLSGGVTDQSQAAAEISARCPVPERRG